MFEKVIKNEKIMLVFMCFITLMSRCLLIFYMDGPFIYADEMGYWSHAANMAGLQWSIDGTSWYSYGYSILLVPLFWISHNISLVYKMALLLNAIMSVICYLLCYNIASEIAPKLEKWMVGIISLVVVMYPSFIAQSYIAWAETELFVLVWFLLWLVMHYEEKQTLWCAGLIGLTVGYLYLVHNRMIGVMIACALIAIVMVFFKKMRWQDAGVIILLLVIIYSINAPIKSLLNIKFTANFMDTMRGNDISTGVRKIKKLFSIQGIQAFLYSLAGQTWYLAAATGLLFFWGIKACVDKIIKRKEHFLFYSFFLLSFAGIASISVISAMGTKAIDVTQRVRLDPFFYGRYIECIIGPLLLFGLIYLVQAVFNKREILWYGFLIILLIVSALGLGLKIKGVNDFYVQSCSVYGLEYYRWFGDFSIVLCTIVGIVLSFILLCGFGRAGETKFYRLRILLVSGLCILFWGLTALQGIRSFEMVEQRYTKEYDELFAYIRELDADKIYVYGTYKEAADIQSRTVDKAVIRLSDDVTQIDRLEEGDYLVVEMGTAESCNLEQFEKCWEYLNYSVYRK